MKKYIKNSIGTIVSKVLCVIFITLISMRAYSETESSIPYESFNVSINFDKIGYKNFQALYVDPAKLYLPVNDVFSFLKIPTKANEDGSLIQGFFNDEKNTFIINYSERSIIYQGQKTVLSKEEMILDMNQLFIQKDALAKIFDFKINFDFRALSANFGSTKELPLARLLKLEKARENLRQKTGEEKADTAYKRNYHWFKFGMMDWTYTSIQSKEYTGESRGSVALGAEVFGGETNVWLTYSDRYDFKREQQRYYWRWVENQNPVVKQIQIGRISTPTIASVLYPVDGFTITNAPTTVRKALGSYQLADYTQPNWLVEIYINSVLINYTKADASGYYSFNVPIVYGTSNITLRFYGPNGEEKSQEKIINMPYTMLPQGEFEYRATGGTVLDTTNSKYAKAETNYGITRWLTVGAGVEYLASINTHPQIPFLNLTFQPIPKLIITGEYDHNVRAKGILNYTIYNSVIDLNYIKYKKGQDAIIYNYLEERSGSVTLPFRIEKVSLTTKGTFKQDVYSTLKYNTSELMFSAYYLNYNVNLTNYANWISQSSYSNIYSNLALSSSIGKICTLRPSIQYNYSTQSVISYKINAERKVLKQGYLSLGYEKNRIGDYNSFNVTFRYDFTGVSTYLASYFNNNQVQTSESANGSFAFGSGNNYVLASRYNAVGRSSIVIEPYLDLNFNNQREANEPLVGNLNVKCSGGQIYYREKDSLTRISGLEPFVDYTVTIDESNFQNVSWKLSEKRIKVTTDPNQFKKISIAVHPMGEVSGIVSDNENVGKGRILLNVSDSTGRIVASTQSESDGFFLYLGLTPGRYSISVDSTQLRILKLKSKPVSFIVKSKVEGDALDIGKILIEKSQKPVIDTIKVKQPLIVNTPIIKQNVNKKDTLDNDSLETEIYYLIAKNKLIIKKTPIKDNEILTDALIKVLQKIPCIQIRITMWKDSTMYVLLKNKIMQKKINATRLVIANNKSNKLQISLESGKKIKCDKNAVDKLLPTLINLNSSYIIQYGEYKLKHNAMIALKKLQKKDKKIELKEGKSSFKLLKLINSNTNKANLR